MSRLGLNVPKYLSQCPCRNDDRRMRPPAPFSENSAAPNRHHPGSEPADGPLRPGVASTARDWKPRESGGNAPGRPHHADCCRANPASHHGAATPWDPTHLRDHPVEHRVESTGPRQTGTKRVPPSGGGEAPAGAARSRVDPPAAGKRNRLAPGPGGSHPVAGTPERPIRTGRDDGPICDGEAVRPPLRP